MYIFTLVFIFIMPILGQAESFKTIKRPNLTVTHFDSKIEIALLKVSKIGTLNFDTIFMQESSICAIKILDRYLQQIERFFW